MKSNTLEIIMGAVVLIGAAFFLSLIYKAADLKTNEGYVITAEFGNTGGLKIGDDVRVSGIKVGKIISQSLNENTFNAQINMRIDNKIKLPIDTSARITSSSLLGGNFLELKPGIDEELLIENEIIYDTRDPVSFSDLLGKFVFQGKPKN